MAGYIEITDSHNRLHRVEVPADWTMTGDYAALREALEVAGCDPVTPAAGALAAFRARFVRECHREPLGAIFTRIIGTRAGRIHATASGCSAEVYDYRTGQTLRMTVEVVESAQLAPASKEVAA